MKTKKVETIDFREFMAGTYRKQPTRLTYAYAGFLPVITPQKLFPMQDEGFALLIVGVGTITFAAFFEQFLARSGFTGAAYEVAKFGRFVFPALAYGSVLWLFLYGLRGL